MELWLESSAAEGAALECQHWEDKTLLTRPEMLNHVHHTALDRLRKQVRACADACMCAKHHAYEYRGVSISAGHAGVIECR